jgi:hypothetical protein
VSTSGVVTIAVVNKTYSSFIGTNVVVISSVGAVLQNTTIATSAPVSTPTLDNATNCQVKITTPRNDGVVLNHFDIDTNKSFLVQSSVISGSVSSLRSVSSEIIASNVSGTVLATLVFNVVSVPNKVCSCASWSFETSSCSASWICHPLSDYQYKYSSGVLKVNVTHFSAYVVGSTETLGIWDDTNDVLGQDIKH